MDNTEKFCIRRDMFGEPVEYYKKCMMCNRKNAKFTNPAGLRHSTMYIMTGDPSLFTDEEWICDDCLKHIDDSNYLKKRKLSGSAKEYFNRKEFLDGMES